MRKASSRHRYTPCLASGYDYQLAETHDIWTRSARSLYPGALHPLKKFYAWCRIARTATSGYWVRPRKTHTIFNISHRVGQHTCPRALNKAFVSSGGMIRASGLWKGPRNLAQSLRWPSRRQTPLIILKISPVRTLNVTICRNSRQWLL